MKIDNSQLRYLCIKVVADEEEERRNLAEC